MLSLQCTCSLKSKNTVVSLSSYNGNVSAEKLSLPFKDISKLRRSQCLVLPYVSSFPSIFFDRSLTSNLCSLIEAPAPPPPFFSFRHTSITKPSYQSYTYVSIGANDDHFFLLIAPFVWIALKMSSIPFYNKRTMSFYYFIVFWRSSILHYIAIY